MLPRCHGLLHKVHGEDADIWHWVFASCACVGRYESPDRNIVSVGAKCSVSSLLARNAAIARDLGSVWDSTSIWTETPSLLMGSGSIDGGLIPVYETSDGNVVNVGATYSPFKVLIKLSER